MGHHITGNECRTEWKMMTSTMMCSAMLLPSAHNPCCYGRSAGIVSMISVGEYRSYSGISGITDSFRTLSRLGESVEVLTKALQKALET